MDFVSGRDNGSGLISEEQEHSSARGKLPFSYSSSPSSSSSSTHQYKSGPALVPLNNWDSQIYETHNNPHQRVYEAPPHTKLELMDSSSRNNDVVNEIRRSDESDHQNTSAAGSSIEREHMFDKVVTPSDVGKLNRLVIPKQHAEKYFPLDSSTNEKGLLLNFEDRNGKPWRFRYSYWNSSQSYVMTKGWSRFVKEKKLDAGDIVSFQRGVGELGKDHLYIDWRRRPDAPDNNSVLHANIPFHHPHHLSFHHRSFPWNHLLMRPPHQVAASVLAPRDHLPQHLNYGPNSYIHRNIYNSNSYGYGNVVNSTPASAAGPVFYLRSAVQGEDQHGKERIGGFEQPVFESVPVVEGKAAAKRLRLFGVNMDCPITESDDECEVLTSAAVSNVQPLQLSSSSRPPVQLRLYNGTPLQAMPTNHHHHHHDFVNKGKNSKSFDFDI